MLLNQLPEFVKDYCWSGSARGAAGHDEGPHADVGRHAVHSEHDVCASTGEATNAGWLLALVGCVPRGHVATWRGCAEECTRGAGLCALRVKPQSEREPLEMWCGTRPVVWYFTIVPGRVRSIPSSHWAAVQCERRNRGPTTFHVAKSHGAAAGPSTPRWARGGRTVVRGQSSLVMIEGMEGNPL